MQIYIYISLDTDRRWRRVIDGQLEDQKPRVGDNISFLDIEDGAVAYTRGTDGSHVFLCTKKMAKIVGSIRPKLLAILNDDELCFSGRIIEQLRLPSWFTDLEEDGNRRGTIINELSDFSGWVYNEQDDHRVVPKFDRTLIAQIADKLLTAVSKNERAKIALACDLQNLEKAQKLLYYVLRCLPVKICNKVTFNTAAKELFSFDICCGNFSEAEVNKVGGVRIDIEKALSAHRSASCGELFLNDYAYYLQMLSKDKDPCEGFYDEDDVDALNTAVGNKVIEEKGNRLVTKCNKDEVTVEELYDFADSAYFADRAKSRDKLVEKQLHKIADYLCLNYIGFTNCYLRLKDKYKSFYASFVTDQGRCPNWGSVENVDALFVKDNETKDDEKCNRDYLKFLYAFWLGKKRNTVYKNNKTIEQFLFSKFDERFQKNGILKDVFYAYWNSLTEEKLLEYLNHGTAWEAKVVLDYIVTRKGGTLRQFVENCCEWKTNNKIAPAITDRLCNKYLSEKMNEASGEDLQWAQEITKKNAIALDAHVLKQMRTKVNDEIKKHCDAVITFLANNKAEPKDLETHAKEDRNVAKHYLKRKKDARENDMSKELIVYNIARRVERDCGEAGNIHNADWSGRLRMWSVVMGIVFAILTGAFAIVDLYVFKKLYIYGWGVWAEVVLTGVMLFMGAIRWFLFAKKEWYWQGDCGPEQYKSKIAVLLVRLFSVCSGGIFVKVLAAVIFISL